MGAELSRTPCRYYCLNLKELRLSVFFGLYG